LLANLQQYENFSYYHINYMFLHQRDGSPQQVPFVGPGSADAGTWIGKQHVA
jgi:hypothetical protein